MYSTAARWYSVLCLCVCLCVCFLLVFMQKNCVCVLVEAFGMLHVYSEQVATIFLTLCCITTSVQVGECDASSVCWRDGAVCAPSLCSLLASTGCMSHNLCWPPLHCHDWWWTVSVKNLGQKLWIIITESVLMSPLHVKVQVRFPPFSLES